VVEREDVPLSAGYFLGLYVGTERPCSGLVSNGCKLSFGYRRHKVSFGQCEPSLAHWMSGKLIAGLLHNHRAVTPAVTPPPVAGFLVAARR
jgi:hypothetical protein